MIRLLGFLAFSLLIAACSADAPIPDTQLIVGAQIITMADAPQPEAMLIEQGRITALGPEDRLREFRPTG